MVQSNIARKIGLIVAVDKNLGIGRNGSLPWSLKADMKHFVDCTTNTEDPSKINAVIMGRKCWESIPEKFRPLKNRLNIVVSRTLPECNDDDLIITNSFEKIVEELLYGQLSTKIERVWNIGGGEIYKLALQNGMVDQIIMTKIEKDFDADVFLDGIDWNHFQEDESARSDILNEKGLNFSFYTYNYVP
ncbi:dihydrofolate reductase [Dictyocaulus viviparus]|uniref:dihydrofolate reductase n=1 Tax=Dictyocaulus viviparus TaxID=29172 RepID=A0A0D8YF28_DICVI|nr:dihydrofolate reductase [Dictyocaulus viviparus]